MEPFITTIGSTPCAMCRTTSGEGIDLGVEYNLAVEIDRIGAITLCTNCFKVIADKMGYAPVKLTLPVKVIGLSESDKERIEDAIFNLGSIISDNRDIDSSSTTDEEAETGGRDNAPRQSVSAFSIEDSAGVPGNTDDDDLFSIIESD